MRRLLLEKLAHSFRKDVLRRRLVVGIAIGIVIGERDSFPAENLLRIIPLLLFAFYQLSSVSTGIKQEQVATPQINTVPFVNEYTSIVGDIKDQKVIYLSRTYNRLISM